MRHNGSLGKQWQLTRLKILSTIHGSWLMTQNHCLSWIIGYFFLSNEIDKILDSTNTNLSDRRKAVTKHEYYKVTGILYAMSLNTLPTRRDYWSTQSGGIFAAPAFGARFWLGLHRFEEILTCIKLLVLPLQILAKVVKIVGFKQKNLSIWFQINGAMYFLQVIKSQLTNPCLLGMARETKL